MLVLIIYQIKDAKLRSRLQKLLMDYGQKRFVNVFECELNSSSLSSLRGHLSALPLGEDDTVLLYPLCLACVKNISSFGAAYSPVTEDPSYIVF